jgi:putative endonuclease
VNNYKFGLFGEYFLIFLLILKGYKVVAKRYRTYLGEIDVIASRKNELVAFEVKSSRSKKLTSELVSFRQENRIRNALNIFLSKNNKYIDYNISYCIFCYRNIFNYKFFK